MSTNAITAPTLISAMPNGTYGWLLQPNRHSSPHPVRRGDKVTLSRTARLVPAIRPTDPAAHRVIREADGSYTLETCPGTTIIHAISTPWDLERIGDDVHISTVVEATRPAFLYHAARDAIRGGEFLGLVRECGRGLFDAVRWRFVR